MINNAQPPLNISESDDKQIYSIWFGPIGKVLGKYFESDSWNVISHKWRNIKYKFKHSKAEKIGYWIAELRINDDFIFERRTNTKIYRVQIEPIKTDTTTETNDKTWFKMDFVYRDSASQYAKQFAKLGHCVKVYQSLLKGNDWLLILTLKPMRNWRQQQLIIRPKYELKVI